MPRFNAAKIQKLKSLDNVIRKFFFLRRNKIYPAIVKEDVREIVLLCMYLIGDTIMFLPVLTVLKNNFPNARITMVCGKAEEIILKDQGLVDKFIIVKCPWITFDYSFKAIINFFSKLKPINRIKYDMAIDFRGDWRNIFFMNFIKSSRKISYSFTGGEYMLTDVILPDPNVIHYIDESFFLLKQLGCEFKAKEKLPVLKLTEKDALFISNFKEEHQLNNKFVIGVHPGASLDVKKWDEKKFAELITRISIQYPETIFVLYEGPNERNTLDIIEKIIGDEQVDFIIVRETLDNYISLLSMCQLVICNDSGAAHIACAFSIPTVVIYGNVDPGLVQPYGSKMLKIISHKLDCKPCHQSTCKFGTNLCIAMVTVDEVYNAASSMIKLLAVCGSDKSR